MAELLVKLASHWQDSLTLGEIDEMTAKERVKYEARWQPGDVIVVRPDGWKWGREECPPRFIVVRLKGTKVEDVKHYEDVLMDKSVPGVKVLHRLRRHRIDPMTFSELAASPPTLLSLDQAKSDALRASMVDKNDALGVSGIGG